MKTNVHIFNYSCGETEHASELIDALANTPVQNGGCFDTLIYRMSGPHGCCKAGTNHNTLFASSSINICTTHNGYTPFTPCFKCVRDGKVPGAIPHKTCAHNLVAGKCVDEYMRNTVGAVLFPQFYGKEK